MSTLSRRRVLTGIAAGRGPALFGGIGCSVGCWRGPLPGIPIALKDNIDTAGCSHDGRERRVRQACARKERRGLPSISIPCGFSPSGLPIDLQISGPPFGDTHVLAVARAFERATTWHERAPAL